MSSHPDTLAGILETERLSLRRYLAHHSVPTFYDSWRSLENVLSAEVSANYSQIALLNFVDTYCNVAKKRIFSSIDTEGTMFELSELDHLEMELDAMSKLGNRFPEIDIDIVTHFVDLVCEISCYYVHLLDKTLKSFDQIDRRSEEAAQKKVAFLEGLRVSAFRLRYFCLSIIDMVTLQDSFTMKGPNSKAALIKVSQKYSLKCIYFDDVPNIHLFVTQNLLEHENLLKRFLKSNVDTSDELASEMVLVCRNFDEALCSEKQINLGKDHGLRKLITITANCDVHVFTKSSMCLRKIRLEILRQKAFCKVSSGAAGFRLCQGTACETEEPRRSFVCLRDIIVQSQADICMRISDFLTDINFEDILVMSRYHLVERFDRSTISSLSFVIQFLLDATEYTDIVERIYIAICSRTFFWIDFGMECYINNINRKWMASYLVIHLENMNTIFGLEMFKPLSRWQPTFAAFKQRLESFKETTVSELDRDVHSYLIDQANHLRENWSGFESTKKIRLHPNSPDDDALYQHDYSIISSLGVSPYYRCLDLRTRRLVAVKKLLKYPDPSAETLRREIDIIMALKHPNIIQYLNSFETEKEMFLVMEYCESRLEICSGLENPKPLPEDDVRSIGRQILKGLSYLHSNHVVHRDIKPSNILRTGIGFVKIADFGDALITFDTSSPSKFDMGTLSGTPQYMAPECLHQPHVTSCADIWSFGCVLIYLLTTNDPWNGCDNKFNVLFKLGSSTELPIDIENASCSDAAKNILRTILVRDPSKRPSALELLNMDFFSKVENSII